MTDTDLVLIVQVAFPFIASLAVALYTYIASKTPATQKARIEEIVTTVVHSVEQAAPALDGASKRQEVLRMISVLLGQFGLKASPELLSTLVEAAVFSMNTNRMTAATVRVPVVSK